MRTILDAVIQLRLQRAAREGQAAMDLDESARSFKAWPPLIRHLAVLRLIDLKRGALVVSWAQAGRAPSRDQLSRALVQGLGRPPRLARLAAMALSKRIGLLLLVPTVALAALGGARVRARERVEQTLTADLPIWCDLVHIMLRLDLQRTWSRMVTEGSGVQDPLSTEVDQKLPAAIDAMGQRIRAALPRDPRLQEQVETAMREIREGRSDAETVLGAWAGVSQRLNELNLPFYLQANTFTEPCYSLLPLAPTDKLLFVADELAHVPAGSPEATRLASICTSTMIATYEVEELRRYELAGHQYPVQILQRLDRMKLAEAYLGITYAQGWGSQVYRRRVGQFMQDAVLAAFTARGRAAMIPAGLLSNEKILAQIGFVLEDTFRARVPDDVAALESLSRALAEQDGYLEQARLRQLLLRPDDHGMTNPGELAIESLSTFMESVLNGTDEATDQSRRIDARVVPLAMDLEDAVAAHEVTHQWQRRRAELGEPDPSLAWPSTALAGLGEQEAVRVGREAEAYLVSMSYAPGLRHLVVTQLYVFALNHMAATSPEHHAATLTLASLLDTDPAAPVRTLATDGPELTDGYAALAQLTDEELGQRADVAHLRMFGRPAPDIVRVDERW